MGRLQIDNQTAVPGDVGRSAINELCEMIRFKIVTFCLLTSLAQAQPLPATAENIRFHQSTAMQFIRTGLLERDARGVNGITLPGVTKTILGDRTIVERLEAATNFDRPDALALTSVQFAETDDDDAMLALTRRMESVLFPNGTPKIYEKLVQTGRARPMKSLRARVVALAEFKTSRDGDVRSGYLLISTEDVGEKSMVASMQLRW
jgi:hypothetical protein